MYALIDGNSFFASCERVFRPDLWHRPVIVLSNNDGCVVARSAEAKQLGIKMAVPMYQVAALVKRHQVAVFSSNYELYADMSARMMQTIASLVPGLEVYSIDEAFADISGLADPTQLGFEIKKRVMQWVGIPTCVGIAPTKTLAKFANHTAKANPEFVGVCDWTSLSDTQRQARMQQTSVTEIWGIGRRLGEKLANQGITSVYDLYCASPATLRVRYGVTVERIVRELHGHSCLALEEVAQTQKQIIRTRSFGAPVTDKEELRAAIAMHLHDATSTLRQQGSVAACVGVMIYSDRFRHDQQHFGWDIMPLSVPSCDTFILTRAADQLLDRLYQANIGYKKAGVVLSELSNGGHSQLDLLNTGDSEKQLAVMKTLDQINQRFGKRTLRSASELVGQQWHTRREHLSPRYTTQWGELRSVG